MSKITESIYNGKAVIVPLADVQHLEPYQYGIQVITKHTRWDCEHDVWANPINVPLDEAVQFKAAWCRYRAELEADTLADLMA